MTKQPINKCPPWKNDEERTIEVDLGLAEPIVLKVRKFVPAEDNVIERF